MTNEQRILVMDSRVDELRELYMRSGTYVDDIDKMEAMQSDEDTEDDEIEDKKEDCEEVEDAPGDKPKRAKRYYYLGGLLYPTKNERHYRIYKRIRELGVSYAMVFHFEEFQRSILQINRKCFLQGDIRSYSDIIEMKSRNEKFFNLNTGKEIRLIEPHIHFLLRWDSRISVNALCKILNLEPNLMKFHAADGKFLRNEYNALNYMVHCGRSKFKFSKKYLMDLNTDPDDDIQDRAVYSVDDVVACPKWYRMLCQQVADFGDTRTMLFYEFRHWYCKEQRYIRHWEVIEWFNRNALYNDYYMTNKQNVRSDCLKMIREYNEKYASGVYN